MNGNRLFTESGALAELCKRHHIRRLSLFGSVLHGSASANSDIDLLVEFDPDAIPGFIGMVTIEEELSQLLGGRRVDLRTEAELGRYIRERVLREAEVQFAA